MLRSNVHGGLTRANLIRGVLRFEVLGFCGSVGLDPA